MRKAIFIFRHYASPPNLPGSVRHHLLARTMFDYENDTYIFTSNFHHMLKKNVHKIKGLYHANKYNDVNYIWLHGIKYSGNGIKRLSGMMHYGMSSYRAAIKLHQHRRIKPQLVIGSIAHSFAALSAYLVSKHFGAKFWLDIGDLWPEGLIKAGTLTPRHPLTYILKSIADYLYKRSEIILVLNNSALEYFYRRGFDKHKVILFPPGAIFDKPVCNREVHKRNFFRIVYTGSLSALYPLEEAIKAVANLINSQPIQLVLEIVGEGPDKQKLQAIANKICPGNIVFTGIVTKEGLVDIYRRADALLVIEKDVAYGFPNKLIDYLATAKPIIIAAKNDYDLKDSMAIRTIPTVEHLLNAIKKLTKMRPQERELMGLNAFQYGQKKFDIKANYSKLLQNRL